MFRQFFWPVFLLVVALAVPALFGGVESLRMLARIQATGWALLTAMAVAACALEMLRGWILLRPFLTGLTMANALGIYFGVMLVACLTPYGLLAPVMLVFLLRRHGVAPRLSLATLLVTTLLDAFAMAFWMLAAIAVEAVVSFRLMVPWMAVMSCMALMLGVMIGATFFVKYPRRWLQLASGVATMFQLRAQTRRGVIRLLLRLRRASS